MDKNRSEIFGQFSYDESLTYEKLLDVESALTANLEALLRLVGAVHLDFTPLGDTLMCQCALEAHKLHVYRKIAQEAAALLPHGVTGRLLCVDKSLAALHVYWIQPGQWQEEEAPVPVNPPPGLKIWHVPAAPAAAESADATGNEN
ncbi:hypothetical protein [uncultured Desulfovibrio sp.]|uniref:hypothetical protein n=1 Tax=uncultured Desulfovibrio sp. TaxID=167968 RepID=UPI00039F1D46|nr:hypothetical protein [uncultured Desulfovibrio sp.]